MRSNALLSRLKTLLTSKVFLSPFSFWPFVEQFHDNLFVRIQYILFQRFNHTFAEAGAQERSSADLSIKSKRRNAQSFPDVASDSAFGLGTNIYKLLVCWKT